MDPLTSIISSVGVGNVIAGILSWKRNEDVGYAVIHFLIGWPYVIWWFFSED